MFGTFFEAIIAHEGIQRLLPLWQDYIGEYG
jgi:hypothetical protein